MVMEKLVLFAIGNVDFSEDTLDGKRTFHGTAVALSDQRIDPDDKLPGPDQSRLTRELPD